MTSMMRTEVDGGGILYTLGEAHALPQQRDALQEDTGASCRGLRQKKRAGYLAELARCYKAHRRRGTEDEWHLTPAGAGRLPVART